MNKFFTYVTLLLLMSSCIGEDQKVPISQESMEWFYDGEVETGFQLINSDNIQTSFRLYDSHGNDLESNYYSNSLDVDLEKIDEYIQAFYSTYDIPFNLHVASNYPPFGDRFTFSLGDVSFVVDMKYEQLIEVQYKQVQYLSLSIGEDEYEVNEPIYSEIAFLDSYEINGQNYIDVLHFTFNDFSSQYDDYTIREIYIAKHQGVICYRLNNGIIYERL